MIVRTLLLVLLGMTPALAQTPNNPPPSSQNPPRAQACPPGTHWEPAGYVHDGKWRDAGYLKDGGRE
jgi:hypothetical protein